MTEVAPPILDYAPRLSRLRALTDMKGIWSLGDQAILSLGNFLTTWMLLRMRSDWYGNYYTVLTFITFLNNLHMSLVTYPLSITSGGQTESQLRRRVRRAIGFTLLLSIPEAIALGVGTRITTHHWSLMPIAFAALLFWQLQETVRRALMARLEHRRAVAGDIVSYLVQAGLVWFAIQQRWISIEWAFGLIALTSAAAFFIQALQLRLHVSSECVADHTAHHQARHHFSLGQWILLATSVNLLTIYSIPWIMRYLHGQAGVAAYSAVLLVLNASNPLQAAMANLITPVVANAKAQAHRRGQSGDREAARAALKYACQGAAVLLPLFGFLMLMPSLALHVFYKADSPYRSLGTPMRIFAVVYALMYLSSVVNSYLCGLGRTKSPFYGQLANAAVTCIITIPMVAIFGLTGAAIGGIFAVSAQLAVGCYNVHQVRRESAGSGFPVLAQAAV